MMKWSLQELNRYQDTGLSFDETLSLNDELTQRDTDVLAVSPVHVVGQIVISRTEYIIHAEVTCTTTLPSTRSLQPVDVPMAFSVDEIEMTKEQFENRSNRFDDDMIMILEKDLIDLDEIIADHILLNLPTQVLSAEEQSGQEPLPSGNEWEVISEDDFNARQSLSKQNQVDPRLAKLSALLDDDKD